MFYYFSGVSAPIYLLDTVSASPLVAYDLRLLRTGYSGKCIKVRRSNDDATQDIGFVDGILDTASLLSFVGANNGFIDTWYDQSTNGINLTQATTANQPKIVSSGSLVTQNSKATISFDRTIVQWLTASIGDIAQPNTMIFVNSVTSITSSNGRIIDGMDSATPKRNYFDIDSSKIRMSGGTQQDMANADTNLNVYSAYFNGASSKVYVNGTINNAPASIGTNNISGLYIGRNPANNVFLTGNMSSLIMFGTLELGDTDRGLIEASNKTYYGTP